jgi:RNA polymerase sigma factor (sigma-70 family)
VTSTASPPSEGAADASGPPTPSASGPGPDGRSEDWLSDLFGRHSGAVHAYARRRVDTAEDAEDVVVEVFTTAWRRRADVPAEALPWLYATAANVIAHVLRSDARRTRLGARLATVSSLHSSVADPGTEITDAVAAGSAVNAALGDLVEADAELLRLWAWEQLEPTEIAEVLGCTPGTVRTRLHRARARLRAALAHRGVEDAQLGPAPGSEHDSSGHPSATRPPRHPAAPSPSGTAAPVFPGDEEVLP